MAAAAAAAAAAVALNATARHVIVNIITKVPLLCHVALPGGGYCFGSVPS